ncbi:MAG: MarR family winged helix-turn-helix transcriptional regulator, partial [Gammaproteobacteria bacterium]
MQEIKLFKLIDRISTLLRSEERKKYTALGLQPVHGQILDYLAKCNKLSDTPAAVTEYFGLTKGTVSQSLQVLERKGYIEKNPNVQDRRILHLSLSENGERLL